MTVVFTDLVGSTQTLLELGPSRSQSFRREHDRLVSGCIRSTGGVFAKNTGDGFMAVFESAQDALRFSSQVQSASRTIDLRWRDIDVGIRVGISTGDVQPDQGDWFGPAVNEAARLCDLASGGQVLASVTTAVTCTTFTLTVSA